MRYHITTLSIVSILILSTSAFAGRLTPQLTVPAELSTGVDLQELSNRIEALAAQLPPADSQGAGERFIGVTVTYGKDGKGRLEGLLVRETAESVYVSRGVGSTGIPRSSIVKIEYGRNKYVDFMQREAATDPQDAAALWDLSQWAKQQSMNSLAKKAAESVIAADPDHALAREYLGFQRYEGAWFTFSEVMAAKGFVRYKGDWLTPEGVEAAKEEERRIREARIEAARLRKLIRLERERTRRLEMEMRLRQQQAYLRMIASRIYYPGSGHYRGVYGYWTYPNGSWVFIRVRVPGHHRPRPGHRRKP